MGSQVSIRWTQTTIQGTPLNRWAASLEMPRVIRGFASVNLEGGIWRLTITRLGRKPSIVVPYQSLRLAKRHLERWMAYHWPTVGGLDMGEPDRRAKKRWSSEREAAMLRDYLRRR